MQVMSKGYRDLLEAVFGKRNVLGAMSPVAATSMALTVDIVPQHLGVHVTMNDPQHNVVDVVVNGKKSHHLARMAPSGGSGSFGYGFDIVGIVTRYTVPIALNRYRRRWLLLVSRRRCPTFAARRHSTRQGTPRASGTARAPRTAVALVAIDTSLSGLALLAFLASLASLARAPTWPWR